MANYPVATASICWSDNDGFHIRVYWSDGYTIRERCADTNNNGGAWTDGSFSQTGTQVSAITWQDGGTHIRVYCTFEDSITEWCADPGDAGWTQGAFTA